MLSLRHPHIVQLLAAAINRIEPATSQPLLIFEYMVTVVMGTNKNRTSFKNWYISVLLRKIENHCQECCNDCFWIWTIVLFNCSAKNQTWQKLKFFKLITMSIMVIMLIMSRLKIIDPIQIQKRILRWKYSTDVGWVMYECNCEICLQLSVIQKSL